MYVTTKERLRRSGKKKKKYHTVSCIREEFEFVERQLIFALFFSLQFWLDLDKQMNHQVGLSAHEPLLRFCVKFYTPDPAQIEEEYTRYLFGLQIKRDLSMGLLQCNDNTAALMASYIVQGKTEKSRTILI